MSVEEVNAIRAEADRWVPEEFAYEHRETTLEEAGRVFRSHRRTLEGVDFKATTAKAFKTNLRGALRAAKESILVADLTADEIARIRVELVNACKSRSTAANYGQALIVLLRWYWASDFFVGGTIPRGVKAVFAKFPKKQRATPIHLTNEVLRVVFAEATEKRRLYLLTSCSC